MAHTISIVHNKKTLSQYPDILTRSEAAALLRVSPDTVSRMVASGKLPALVCDHTLRIAKAEILRLLTNPPVATVSAAGYNTGTDQ